MKFLVAELSTSFLISPSLAFAKCFFLFCFPLMTNCNFRLNVCSFLGFSSVEKNQSTDIKSDREYLVNKPLPAAGISADNVRG